MMSCYALSSDAFYNTIMTESPYILVECNDLRRELHGVLSPFCRLRLLGLIDISVPDGLVLRSWGATTGTHVPCWMWSRPRKIEKLQLYLTPKLATYQ